MGLGGQFIQVDWLIILAFCFVVALTTIAPEFYAMAKAPARWIPINSPPFSMGDDYHYFSLLNNVHRRLINRIYGSHLTVSPLSANSKFQLFGYLFNLIPYHFGYLVADRRLGIVFVRLWNRFLLGFSVSIFSILLYKSVDIVPRTEVVLMTYLIFFLLFPGPFGLGILASILRQLGNRRHIYDRANANDLTRAMFSETTGPLLIIACTLLLVPVSKESSTGIVCIELLFVVILFFHYLPAALVYSFLLFLVLIGNQFIFFAILCSALTLGLVFVYFHLVSRDEIGKEVFAHTDGGRIFTVNRFQLFNAFIVVFCAVATIFLLPKIAKSATVLILLGAGFFVLTNFFVKHQAGRFWDRAAIIPFQIIATVSSLAIIVPMLTGGISVLLICTLSVTLFYYYYRQSIFLYESQATVLPRGLEFIRDVCTPNIESNVGRSRIVATNSIVCAYCIDMFSGDESLLRNYSIQPHGYKKNLVSICSNFKILGMEYKTFESFMTSKVGYPDWQFSRPFEQGTEIAARCYAHTIQFSATNREYNMALVTEGMYLRGGWSDQYRALLRATWDSIDSSKYEGVRRIMLDNPF